MKEGKKERKNERKDSIKDSKGTNINVNGYSKSFKANIYQLQVPRYIPHIV